MTEFSFSHSPLARQPKHHEQRTIEPLGCLVIERSQHLPDAVSAQRVHLVCHDLGTKPQAVRGRGLNHRPKVMEIADVGRHRTNQNGIRRVTELIGLNNNSWTRFAHIALRDEQHHVAALHDQFAGSRTVSSQSSITASSGCLDNIAASRRISASTLGSRKSGTQCCTAAAPRAQPLAARRHALLRGAGL